MDLYGMITNRKRLKFKTWSERASEWWNMVKPTIPRDNIRIGAMNNIEQLDNIYSNLSRSYAFFLRRDVDLGKATC